MRLNKTMLCALSLAGGLAVPALSAAAAKPAVPSKPAMPAAAASAAPAIPADAVAVVNGEAILPAEFDKDWAAFVGEQKRVLKPEAMTPEWEQAKKRLLLDKIIDQRLVLQEAKKRDIKVPKKDLDAALAQVKAKFKVDAKGQPLSAAAQDEAFKKELASQHLSQERFEGILRNQMRAAALTNKVVKERVKQPTDAQIRSLFDAVKAKLPAAGPATADEKPDAVLSLARYFKSQMGERVRLRHILIHAEAGATAEQKEAAQKKAADLKAKLDAGANFAELARQNSDDKRSAVNGGDAGFVFRGQVKELDAAAFSLPVGGISDVIPTKLGFEIIKVEEKRAPVEELDYQDARNYLGQFLLRSAEQEAFAGFLGDLRKSAKIELRAGFAKPS